MSRSNPRRASGSMPAVGSSRNSASGFPASASATAKPAPLTSGEPRGVAIRVRLEVEACEDRRGRVGVREMRAHEIHGLPHAEPRRKAHLLEDRTDASARRRLARIPAEEQRLTPVLAPKPSRIETAVDLPAPLGPRRARISPRRSSRSTPSSARTGPNDRTTFSRHAMADKRRVRASWDAGARCRGDTSDAMRPARRHQCPKRTVVAGRAPQRRPGRCRPRERRSRRATGR